MGSQAEREQPAGIDDCVFADPNLLAARARRAESGEIDPKAFGAWLSGQFGLITAEIEKQDEKFEQEKARFHVKSEHIPYYPVYCGPNEFLVRVVKGLPYEGFKTYEAVLQESKQAVSFRFEAGGLGLWKVEGSVENVVNGKTVNSNVTVDMRNQAAPIIEVLS